MNRIMEDKTTFVNVVEKKEQVKKTLLYYRKY